MTDVNNTTLDRRTFNVTHDTAIATLNGQSGATTGALASVTALDAPLPVTANEGTGIVRMDVYEDNWSGYGRACQMMRLSSLSQTLRTWARETQRTARLRAGATI